MILKFKNRYLMALDKLIKDGDEIGLIESIILEPKEGYGLILEIINLGVKYTKDIIILDSESNDITRAELIWGGKGVDRNEHVKAFLQRWYKINVTVTYKEIPLCIVKPKPNASKPKVPKAEKEVGWKEPTKVSDEKKEDVPELTNIIKSWKVYDDELPAERPKIGADRLIVSEPWVGTCDKCGSSKKTKWFFFDTDKCIQPECENYWDKD